MPQEAKSIEDSHAAIETQRGEESRRPVSSARKPLRGGWAILGGLAFLVFLMHMLVSGRYGYFVDGLFYLACSHHLDWGYVDQAPLIAVVTWLERVTSV